MLVVTDFPDKSFTLSQPEGGTIFGTANRTAHCPVLTHALQAQANDGAFSDIGTSHSAPVSNDAVRIGFKQTIGANDALRTGAYAKSLTFTLSTTKP